VPAFLTIHALASQLTGLEDGDEDEADDASDSRVQRVALPTLELTAARAERACIVAAIRELAASYAARGWEESELTLEQLADDLEGAG
jgi:hypothetical protein